MSDNPYIQEVGVDNFDEVVINLSHQLPVLVDFWADWCQPCQMLMPILSKLAEEYQGKFILAKINTEEHQSLAAQQGIRSLPTVRLYQNGEPVDEFMGALPEEQIRAFLDKHIANESDMLLSQAEQHIAMENYEQAVKFISEAENQTADPIKLTVCKARLVMAQGDNVKAKEFLNTLDINQQQEPAVIALLSELELKQKLGDIPDQEALNQRLIDNADDSEARYQLALLAMANNDYENALEQLLTLLIKDRGFQDDVARKTMLDIFNLLGGEGELVSRYRNRMFTALH